MSLKIVAGTFKGRLLKAPKNTTTRPTQSMLREAVFNMCQFEIVGARFLDLYAGSGAMGLEALSRGASHVTLIEQNRFAAACIRENIALLKAESQVTFYHQEATRALSYLKKSQAQFDIVYIDPPYDQPIALDPLLPLLAPQALLFLEERFEPKKPHKPIALAGFELKNTKRFGIALLSIYTKTN